MSYLIWLLFYTFQAKINEGEIDEDVSVDILLV